MYIGMLIGRKPCTSYIQGCNGIQVECRFKAVGKASSSPGPSSGGPHSGPGSGC